MKYRIILIGTLLSFLLTGCTGKKQNYRVKIDDHLRAQQISDMKFGMFICWSFSTFYGHDPLSRFPQGGKALRSFPYIS